MRISRALALVGVSVVAIAAVVWIWRAGPRHPRVLLIGVDGADPAILDRLIRENKLPTFARLQREGAFGRLRSREPLLSPVIWTTIVTGRKPQDHGVLDFVEAAADGHAVPITSSRRRVPALWNIASQFGVGSGFIGWYASFPVERVRGFEVSDRIAFHQVTTDQVTEGAAFPPDLGATLRQRFGDPVPDVAAVRARFLSRPDAPLTADGERRLIQLARMHATTEYYRRIARWLQQKYRPALVGVYFEAIDACGHLFMEDAPPRRPQVSADDYAAFAPTVDRCYQYQDEVIGELLTMADADTLTIICSDHGFKSGDRRPETPGRADVGQAALWHLPYGVILLHGRPVRPGSTLHDATILDIAPTVVRALDLPLARDLPGRPIQEPFAGGSVPRAPAGIARYEWVPVPPPKGAAADAPEKLAELRALGYLSGSNESAPALDGRFAASYLNEGVALYVDGEQRDALHAFARAVQIDPGNVNARAFAARVHLERRDFDRARPLLDEAVALDPRSAYVRLLRANLAISTGQWALADAELSAAAALDARLPMLHVQRARLLNARADPAGALAALQIAESLTDAEPLLLDIVVLRADAASRLGRAAEADAALRRAAELAPPDQIAAARAEVALARGDPQSALTFLKSAVDANPRSAALWSLLGATYGRAGDFSRAIEAYERSVAVAPTALACKTLAALVFEIRHDRIRAVALWEQSIELDRNQPDVKQFLKQYGAEASVPGR